VSLARRLWADSSEEAGAALAHPFIRGIADGSLPRPVFARYVAQDAVFLEAFARAYALALAASPDTETVLAFAGLIAGVRDELSLHATHAAHWGVNRSTTAPNEATLSSTDYLLATAATGTVGLVCAAMTPCMRLYAHLGQSLGAEGIAADSSYHSWVAAYADPAFGHLADQLEALLDAHAADTPAVRAAYQRAMRLELAFFDAVYARASAHRCPSAS
jgi:thiaminase/transcriptional activator TenA